EGFRIPQLQLVERLAVLADTARDQDPAIGEQRGRMVGASFRSGGDCVEVCLPGSNSSVSVTRPLRSRPPNTSTVPSGSTMAVWKARGLRSVTASWASTPVVGLRATRPTAPAAL